MSTAQSENTWEIRAGLLNTIWRDTLPRLVAHLWKSGDDLAEVINDPEVEYPARKLLELIDKLEDERPERGKGGSGGRAEDPDGPSQSALGRKNHVFRRRKEELAKYLEGHANSKRAEFPLHFPGSGGYDFLVSNEGIDFFYPRFDGGEPLESSKQLLEFFTYRRTGRRPVGIPFYCKGGISGLSASVPTGPGQVWLDANWREETLGADLHSCLTECLDSLEWGRPYRFQEVKSLLYVRRRWQVEGSVYCGMMLELPRIVAKAWLEILEAFHNSTQKNFNDGTNDGLRKLFMQKLETSLPTDDRMRFEVYPNGKSGWTGNDVMITNEGFFFPEVHDIHYHAGITGDPDAQPDANDQRELMEQILDQISRGWAGNPVFTDSERTEGGGDWGDN